MRISPEHMAKVAGASEEEQLNTEKVSILGQVTVTLGHVRAVAARTALSNV